MFREFRIRRTLRRLSKARVALVLNPGKVWVIERAMPRNEKIDADVLTCLLRGWVEVLHDDMAIGDVETFLSGNRTAFQRKEPIYRLTEAGWAVLSWDRQIAVLALIFGGAQFVSAVL